AEALFPATVRSNQFGGEAARANPIHDLDVVRSFISGPGALSLLDVPWIPIYLGLAFLLHPWLGTLALAGGLLISALLVINELHSRRPALATTAAAGERSALAQDAASNAE